MMRRSEVSDGLISTMMNIIDRSNDDMNVEMYVSIANVGNDMSVFHVKQWMDEFPSKRMHVCCK
ncbi:hypothetical protein CRD60_03865 [Bifidobacterium aemilianum]|uniref:Uncharacterized protein n=1 Tax=Bifidobacterium aemilianum TaxID=2493120 RepID=A0A366KAQ6_9BIFI|nr:hypothetical protein CRD60_03865 [Bifidobacterium aemilianum]